MWLFLGGIVLLFYTAIDIYTGIRFAGLVRYFFPSLRAFIFWPLYVLFTYSFILILLLRLDRVYFLRQAAMYSLPFLLYFFLGLLAADGVRLGLRLLSRVSASSGFSAAGTGIALGLSVLAMIYGTFHAQDIRTAHYDIILNKSGSQSGAASPLRIALISDLHIGVTVGREWTARIVDAVNGTRPDIICIAGDIFDNDVGAVKDLDGVAAELRRLKAPLGVYACPGNHDVDRMSLSSLRDGAVLDRIHDFLKKADITFLEDSVELVADRFYLAGRRDASVRRSGARQERESAAALAAGLDKSRPIIFMDHQPVDFPREDEAGVDLILSGHTHRGQFFPVNIVTACIYKKAGAVSYGYWRGRSAQGIVSSGAGVWGPPIRIGTASEVAVVDIKFGDGAY